MFCTGTKRRAHRITTHLCCGERRLVSIAAGDNGNTFRFSDESADDAGLLAQLYERTLEQRKLDTSEIPACRARAEGDELGLIQRAWGFTRERAHDSRSSSRD